MEKGISRQIVGSKPLHSTRGPSSDMDVRMMRKSCGYGTLSDCILVRINSKGETLVTATIREHAPTIDK